MASPTRQQVLGAKITRIGHSNYSSPEFVIEGIGPASFRSHYVVLDNGLVLDLFTAYLTLCDETAIQMVGETTGVPVERLIGRSITDVWRDDVFSCLLILDDSLYLKDANDGAYGNPLHAGVICDEYSKSEMGEFVDYWTEEPIQSDRIKR
ncbi:MAG: hypothetical protein ACKN81_11255 [Pirellulaceae bacterium]|jgi:hypothetical protein